LLHYKRAGLQNLQQIASWFGKVLSGYCPFKLDNMLLHFLSTRSQESVCDPLTAATVMQYGVAKSDSLTASGDKYFD
jgi:hypothetical protein